VERGTHLAGSPGVVNGSDVIRNGAENLGLPVGAADSTVGMSGVDPFSLTPQTSDSCLPSTFRHDGEQSVMARQTVRAEVHNEQGFDSPNGQVESEECQCMDFEQLNEQPEIYSGSEQLIEQSELRSGTEQGVGQVGISPTVGEQRGSFASESNDLVRGEGGSSTFASQPEVAVCCPGQDCPLRAVNMAMGMPGRSFTEIAGNDFSCSSHGLDAEISPSPISEQSLAGGFSILNYPAERVDAENDDDDDDMTITRSDLYADTVPQRARTQTCFDNPNNFPSQRPSRNIRRPARFDDFCTQFTQSQHVRKIQCTLSSSCSRARCKQTRNKEVTFERCSSSPWQRQQCREPAATRGYINSAACHFVHYESGGEAVCIGQSIPRKVNIAKTSKVSKTHSASKSSHIVGSVNSIRTRRVSERGRTPQMNSDNGVMARTKQSERKRDGQRQDGVAPAVHGYPCPRCHKVFDRKYNLTRHTVHKHYITPDENPASEQMRSHFLKAGTHNINPAKDEAKAPPLKVCKITKAGFRDDPVSRASGKIEQRVSKKTSAPHTATSTLSATGLDPGELPMKDGIDELARSSTPDLPDSDLEAWEAPVSVDIEIGAQLRSTDFEGEQQGKAVVEPLPESPAVTVNVWGGRVTRLWRSRATPASARRLGLCLRVRRRRINELNLKLLS